MRYLVFVLGMVFVIGLLFLGCAGSGDEMANERQVVGRSGLTLGVEVESARLAVGETLVAVLTVANDRDEAHSVRFTSGCLYGFGLWDASGELVAPAPPMCTMNAPVVEFAAGEVAEHRFEWKWDGSSVEPGMYLLKAGIGPRGELDSSAGVEVELVVN